MSEHIRNNTDISDEVKDFVCKLVEMDPEQRPSAREALKHHWFKKEDWAETTHLETTQEHLALRKIRKQTYFDEFQTAENFSMEQLSKEILRFGLDKSLKPKIKLNNSMIFKQNSYSEDQ